MSEAKFTPGPWKLWGGYVVCGANDDSDGDPVVVTFCEAAKRKNGPHAGLTIGVHSRPHYAEGIANAKLIAAAPEMYEALKSLQNYFQESHVELPQSLHDAYEAALAKAEGRQ